MTERNSRFLGSHADAADGGRHRGLRQARGHAHGLFSKAVDGVVLFGTTGEGTSFNVTERVATVEALLKAGVPASRIGIGGGFPAMTDSIALTRAVLGLGREPRAVSAALFRPQRHACWHRGRVRGDLRRCRRRAPSGHALSYPAGLRRRVPVAVAASLRKRYGRSLRA